MLTALGLAAGVAFGVHPLVLGLAVAAVHRPWWFLAGAGVWGVVARRHRPAGPRPDDEARFLRAVAAELRAGASLRAALDAAAARSPALPLSRVVRLARAGVPLAEVAAEVHDALPVNGRLAAAASRIAGATGARAAELFGALAVRAAEAGELARERRALTAQARLSAFVVGGAPLGLAVLLLATGRASVALESGPAGLALVAVGLALEAAGLAVVVWMAGRSVR